jgi:ribonuclease E
MPDRDALADAKVRSATATIYMAKKMLIDATHLEETRVVVADGNKVDEFDFESINKRQLAGNIYLAKVTRVEPSLQAAFVDYGGNRHGFLAFSEIHPDYYQIPVADREALLAEEAAEQKQIAARDEDADDGERSKPKSRRGARRSRRKQAEPSNGNGEVKGLEVIEFSEGESDGNGDDAKDDGPRKVKGLEIADLPDDSSDGNAAEDAAEIAAAEEPVAPEATTEATAETTADAPAEEVVEAPIEETAAMPADDAASEETNADEETGANEETGPAPKSIAESAGLDDEEESVSEDVLDFAPKVEEAEEKSAPKPKRTRKKAVPKTRAEAPEADAEAEAESAPVAEPEAAPLEVAESEATEAPFPEAEATESAGEAADAPAEEAPKKRSRRRRSRASDKSDKNDNGDAENGDDAAEPADAVESIGPDDTQEEDAKARAKRRRHYKIQDVVKVRQIMLVQVVKEERGNKGAALTTYLSLAGRYCVLMPNTARGGGISRKITSAGDRKRLREITDELAVPNGIGLIVRTAGAERTRAEIKRDYEFLLRQWEQIRELTLKSTAPSLIYEEGSLIKRSIRDLYSKEIDTILVEGEEGYREAKDYMKMLMPSHAKNVQQYAEQIPLFIRYQVESYLNAMFSPVVQLRSGGYIVIGMTEALVAIDVNSGRSTKESSIEETALKTNLEAAEEVCRQLRLRDLAGLIVIDFIDMEDNRNNRAVEKRMKDRLKTDRARIQVGRISGFGLMEMSRQRLRPGMLEVTTQPCPHCQGQGIVRSDENLSLSILREVEEEGVRGRSAEVTVTTPVAIANYIMNMKRAHLAGIEARYGLAVTIHGDPILISPEYRIERSRTRSRQIDAPDVVITAESAVAPAAERVEEAPERAPDERSDERSDERGEGRSRRRRGKRGGQRRRREEGEAGSESGAEQTSEAADAGEGAEGDRRAAGERRSRRRRGGRGRSRRDGEETVTETTEEAVAQEDGIAADTSTDTATDTADNQAAPESQSDTAAAAEPVAEEVAAEAMVEETPPAEADAVDAKDVAAPEAVEPQVEEAPAETAEPEPVVIAETAEPEPEPIAAAPVEPEPAKPAAPKRRGWWSRG